MACRSRSSKGGMVIAPRPTMRACPGSRNRRRPRGRHPRAGLPGCCLHATGRQQGRPISSSTCSPPRGRADHEGDRAPWPHRQVGRPPPAPSRIRFDLHALRTHRLYQRHFRPARSTRCARSAAACAPISGRGDRQQAVAADRTALPAREAVEAQAHMRANKHFGKIVLTM